MRLALAILVLAILLLFGGRKLPELARGLARGMRVFRDELHGVKTDLESGPEDRPDGQGEKGELAGSAGNSDKTDESSPPSQAPGAKGADAAGGSDSEAAGASEVNRSG